MPADHAIHGIDQQSGRPIPFARNSASRIEILECTLRDGSYAVDFKFTERDTALLAGVLSKLGFKWIEVGHGLGLGAARAGKGSMPASDERLIESAKRAATAAFTAPPMSSPLSSQSSSPSPSPKIGSFFIPGIGAADDLKRAAPHHLLQFGDR